MENREAISTVIWTSSNTQLVYSYIISDHISSLLSFTLSHRVPAEKENFVEITGRNKQKFTGWLIFRFPSILNATRCNPHPSSLFEFSSALRRYIFRSSTSTPLFVTRTGHSAKWNATTGPGRLNRRNCILPWTFFPGKSWPFGSVVVPAAVS